MALLRIHIERTKKISPSSIGTEVLYFLAKCHLKSEGLFAAIVHIACRVVKATPLLVTHPFLDIFRILLTPPPPTSQHLSLSLILSN